MKPRIVRAAAACGVVLVALTGASSSNGGGCSSHSGSNKEPGSKHTERKKVGHSKPRATNAIRDIRIVDCAYDEAVKRLTARVTVRNGSSLPYAYSFTVKFTTGVGNAAVSTTASRAGVVVGGGTSSTSTDLQTLYTGFEIGPQPVKCNLQSASRVVQP